MDFLASARRAGLILIAAALPSIAEDTLRYDLTPLPAERQLKVAFAWQTQGATRSTLSVAEHWGPVRDVPPLFTEVQFEGPHQVNRQGHIWKIEHTDGAVIRGSYLVNCNWPMDWEHCYYPTIGTDYLHLIGYVCLLIPGETDTSSGPFRVSMNWNLPEGWSPPLSPWDKGAEQTASLTTTDLVQSIFIAGKFETREVTVLGQPVTVALQDRFKFSSEAFSDLVSRIIQQQRTFMSDDKFPPFLVTGVSVGDLLPEGSSSLGGTGLYNSFAAFLAPNTTMDDRLQHLLSHELFHYWNGRILDREQPEELLYWFSEGLTDYYSSRLLYDSGIWNAQTYVDWVNEKLKAYAGNPDRNATNEQIKEGFWSQRQSVGEVAYQRGLLLAIRWHRMALDGGNTHGLDRLFHHLVKLARDTGYRATNDSLRQHGIEQLGPWFADEFDRYVTRAETVEIPLNSLGPKFEGAVKRIVDHDVGFDLDATQSQRKIIGLRQGSNAEQAGLREGDDLAGWSIELADVNKEAVIQVRRAGQLQEIRYLPQGAAINVVQFQSRQ